MQQACAYDKVKCPPLVRTALRQQSFIIAEKLMQAMNAFISCRRPASRCKKCICRLYDDPARKAVRRNKMEQRFHAAPDLKHAIRWQLLVKLQHLLPTIAHLIALEITVVLQIGFIMAP